MGTLAQQQAWKTGQAGWSTAQYSQGPLVHVSMETPSEEDFSQVYSKVRLGSGQQEHVVACVAQGIRDKPYSSVTSSGNTSPRKWALKSSCRQEARTDSCSESKSSWVTRGRRHHDPEPSLTDPHLLQNLCLGPSSQSSTLLFPASEGVNLRKGRWEFQSPSEACLKSCKPRRLELLSP